MEMTELLALWWVFPASVCIATIAISTGISGALFFAPFFLLVVGLPPAEAIGGGLMTMIFGTGSGTFSYNRQGVVDFTIVKSLLIVTVPFAMLGALVAIMVDADALRVGPRRRPHRPSLPSSCGTTSAVPARPPLPKPPRWLAT